MEDVVPGDLHLILEDCALEIRHVLGEILGISESNVATKISRIKQQLKQAFEAEPDQ